MRHIYQAYFDFVLISVGIQCCNFSLSYFLRIDNFTGSINFCTLTVLSYALSNCFNVKQTLMTAMLIVWSARLGLFLLYRMIKRGAGDDRLDKLRQKPHVLLVFWVSHCLWCLIVSLPVTLFNLVAYSNPDKANANKVRAFCTESFALSNIEIIGLCIWFIGMFVSAVGDQQKFNHYEAHQNDKSKTFCNVGVWRWSRNPNFAGEIILWLGIAIVSAYNLYLNPILSDTLPMYRWCLVVLPFASPVFTALVLLGWSGVPFRERKYWKMFGNKNKAYMKYRKETSLIWPLPPGVYQRMPDAWKRTVFCEWDMFAFRTKRQRKQQKDN